MFIDRTACEREIIKIVNTTSDVTELRARLEQFWGKMISASYNDGVHTLSWFRDKIAQNIRAADNGDTSWERAVDAVCERPHDINNTFKQIEAGALFEFGVNDNTEMFMDSIMKSGDVATASLLLCICNGNIITTDTRKAKSLLSNSMQAAFQSRPEMLKMILGFYPNTFIKPELLELYKQQAPKVVVKTYLQQNLATYNEFLKSRGLQPIFAQEDVFEQSISENMQKNEGFADAEIVSEIKARNKPQLIRQA